MAVAQNNLAKTFKSLHKSGRPVVLVNVYDAPSANAVASLPTAKVIATASYAIAQAAGIEDDDLTYEMNLAATRPIASVAKKYNKPVSVDLQDGYGELLEEAIAAFLQIGIVGINLEDCNKTTHNMYSVAEAVARIRKVLTVAQSHGVPDFVVNARCDILVHGGSLSESIARGQAYLAAGAATVFIWGGSARGGISRDEVVQLVKAFDGRINVSKKLSVDGLTIHELAEMGAARISIGPALQFVAMAKFKEEADKLLQE
jgi:2-methylisocitrate lyase-like PEP mutase family enzyme